MSNGSSRGGGGGGSRRRDVPESAVQEKLARIRARRAERLANRGAELAGGHPDEADDDDDGEESTQAFNIADFDLGGLPSKAGSAPSRPAPPDDDDDDGEEKTAAFNVDALSDIYAQRNRAAAAPSRPAPPPSRPAPPAYDEDDEEEKTAAFSLDDIGPLPGRRPEPARPSPPPARPAPPPARPAPPVDDYDDEDEDGATAAFSLDDLAPPRRAEPPIAPTEEIEEAERTMAVSLDEIVPPSRSVAAEPAGADKTMMVDMEADLQAIQRRSRPEPAAPPPATLVVLIGNDIGRSYSLERDVTLVGRGTDADFVINDASASRRHFNLVRTSSGWKMVDLGSGNGTRIDGQRVQELALRDGMKIECGTTTLEFREPRAAAQPEPVAAAPARRTVEDFDDDDEDKTRMGDMAALEIDPDWEARRARMRAESQQQAHQPDEGHDEPASMEPSGLDELRAEAAPRRGGAGKVAALVGGLLLLGGGGFVAADKAAGLGIIFPKDTTEEVGEGPAGGTAETGGVAVGTTPEQAKEAEGLVVEAEEALAARRWHEAKRHFVAAFELDPSAKRLNGDPVDEAVLLVDDQLAGLKALVDAREAVAEERLGDAIERLKAIRPSTVYHEDAKALLEVVSGDFVAQRIGVARVAIDKGELDEAKKAVDAALAVTKDDPQLLGVKESLDRASADDADNIEVEGEVQDKKAAPIDMSEGLSRYADGDFMSAGDFFDVIVHEGKAGRADRAKAKALAAAITKFEGAFSLGEAALADDRLDDALEHLWLAKKFDLAVNGAYQTHVAEALANVYAAKARSAVEGGRITEAGVAARRALGLNAEQAEAKTISETVGTTARAWIEEAEAVMAEDADKALGLLGQALTVLPVDAPDYKAAYALFDKLTAKGG